MQIALVTGANRGLGFATAERLARQGVHVVLASRDTAAGTEATEKLASEGHAVSHVTLDVTDRSQAHAAASYVAERFGHLDILVNNAGILPEAAHVDPAEAVDLAMFQQTYATNLFGPVAVLEAFLPLLRTSPAGRIVNVSSVVGSLADQTNPESPYFSMAVPAYQSSKAALNNVTIVLSKALADTSIKVTSVCPGWVQTDLAPGNRERAAVTPEAAAEVVCAAAMLPEDAPSGTFVDATGPVPW
jgi:NAD(P)-dependent dehydrogenase (short-subunit alcohol dehydrogenase family)